MKNINEYKKRFFNLLESQMGDVKPLISEQTAKKNVATKGGDTTVKQTPTYGLDTTIAKNILPNIGKVQSYFSVMGSPNYIYYGGGIMSIDKHDEKESFVNDLEGFTLNPMTTETLKSLKLYNLDGVIYELKLVNNKVFFYGNSNVNVPAGANCYILNSPSTNQFVAGWKIVPVFNKDISGGKSLVNFLISENYNQQSFKNLFSNLGDNFKTAIQQELAPATSGLALEYKKLVGAPATAPQQTQPQQTQGTQPK